MERTANPATLSDSVARLECRQFDRIIGRSHSDLGTMIWDLIAVYFL